MSAPIPASQPCPKCGEPMPDNATYDLCPVCLMSVAMNWTQQPTQPVVGPKQPLTPEHLAPHFPQLEVLDLIGRGGMGVVYKARQKSLNRLVALKLLAPDTEKDGSFAPRFATEARALAQMDHPNIVTVYDFGESGGFFYLLMEYVDGVNLRQALQAGRLTPEQALAIVPPVCEALQYAHEHGIVHRDIKPENLLMNKAGRIKIADFGIAKIIAQPEPGREDRFAPPADSRASLTGGTPQYMAPEQRSASIATDHRADIYSLGVVLYELLTGELPTKDLQRPSQRVQVDVRLDQIVLRALEKTPELRFQTVAEMRTQLEEIMPEPNAGKSPKSAPLRSRTRPLIAALWIVGAFLAGAAVVMVQARRKLAQERTRRPSVSMASTQPTVNQLRMNPKQVRLTLVKEGAQPKTRFYKPMILRTGPEKPMSVTRLPENMTQACYGQLMFGTVDAKISIPVLVDQIPSQMSRIFVDSNNNGDFTDDPPFESDGAPPPGVLKFSGYCQVDLSLGDQKVRVQINLRELSTPSDVLASDSQRWPVVVYHLGYYRTADVPLVGGLTMKVILKDSDSDGDFSTDPNLCVDMDRNTFFDPAKESFRMMDAIQIDGVRYQVTDIAPSGETFTWKQSDLPLLVAEKKSLSGPPFTLSEVKMKDSEPLSLAVGTLAPAFIATTLNEKTFVLNKGYPEPGKVLLLDFWATWCGPCIAEIPNLTALHQKHHEQGLVMLGISLDEKESVSRLKPLIAEKKMDWLQVCDGRGSASVLTRAYQVRGIPSTYLIDGDTGIILAKGLRGPALHEAVAKALADKKK